MKITEEHINTCVAYGPSSDSAVVRVTSVGYNYGDYVCVESRDGHGEMLSGSMFHSIEQITEHWRPATEEETNLFLLRYTPPPQNWN